jgi:hypothetical protein
LGVNLHQDPSWKEHVDKTAVKASKTLAFLRGNLYNCKHITESAHNSNLVCPILHYSQQLLL